MGGNWDSETKSEQRQNAKRLRSPASINSTFKSKNGKKKRQRLPWKSTNCSEDFWQVKNYLCKAKKKKSRQIKIMCPFSLWPYWWDRAETEEIEQNICPRLFSPNENVILWLTEFPLMLAISFNFLNTPPAVRLAGWNIVRWLLRELSATRPKSPFSWASALILSNCRPGNESQTLNSSCINRWLAEMGGISGQSENAQLSVWVH